MVEEKIITVILIAIIILSLCSFLITFNLNNSESSLEDVSYGNEINPDSGLINLVVGGNSENE